MYSAQRSGLPSSIGRRVWVTLLVLVVTLGGFAGRAPSRAAPADLYYVFAPTVFYNVVQPGGLPGPGWWMGLQITNVGTATTTVTATAYDASSSATYALQATIPPGNSTTVMPHHLVGLPAGFRGSFVVTATQPIRGIVRVLNRPIPPYGTPGGLASATYEAVPAGGQSAARVYFPLVRQRVAGEQTTLFAQNASAANTAVTAAYACDDGNTYTAPAVPIAAGQAMPLTPAAAGVPDGRQCRATLTAGEPLAVAAFEHYASETEGTRLEATRGLTDADADTVLFAPTLKLRRTIEPLPAWRSTEVTIQNLSAQPITISATYHRIEGSCGPTDVWSYVSPPVAPGATWMVAGSSMLTIDCLAAARFSATGRMLGVVRETFVDPLPGPGTQSSTLYHLVPQSTASLIVLAPLYKERFGSKSSALQVQNTGSTTATLFIEFDQGVLSWRTIDLLVPPGGARNFYHISDQPIWIGTPMPPGSVASAWAYADQPIVAGVTELMEPDCYGQGGGACYDRDNDVAENLAGLPIPTPLPTRPAAPDDTRP